MKSIEGSLVNLFVEGNRDIELIVYDRVQDSIYGKVFSSFNYASYESVAVLRWLNYLRWPEACDNYLRRKYSK